jgi:hypothetical protein
VKTLNEKKIREIINGLAKRANMKEEDLKKLYKKFEYEEKSYGCPDDELEEAVLVDMEAFLRKKFLVGGNTVAVTGTIFGRSNAIDRAKNLHEKAEKYIEAEGTGKAIEDGYAKYVPDLPEKTEENKGELKKIHEYISEHGEDKAMEDDILPKKLVHLYTSDQFNDKYNRTGTPIPEFDWQADGFGVVNYQQKEGVDDIRFADIKFKGVAATGPLPLFKEVSMKAFVTDKKNEKKYRFTVSRAPELIDDEYDNFREMMPLIKKAYPNRVLSFAEVEDFFEDAESKFNLWCLVQGVITGVSGTKKGGSIVDVHDMEMDVSDGSSERIIFARESELDLTEGAQGYFFVNPSRDNEGRMSFFGLGYWVPSYKRVHKELISDEETPDVEKGWG